MKYEIVSSNFSTHVENKVAKFLMDGWELYGFLIVSVCEFNSKVIYTQTLIKKDK